MEMQKKKSFNLVKKYRNLYQMSNYNAIMFNTDSYLRNRKFLDSKNLHWCNKSL